MKTCCENFIFNPRLIDTTSWGDYGWEDIFGNDTGYLLDLAWCAMDNGLNVCEAVAQAKQDYPYSANIVLGLWQAATLIIIKE